jgi:uncharacterized protein YdhG (YjbR/CyaY superfamily)
MVQSKAATVAGYLKELPPERRKVVSTLRRLIRANLPRGYQERMSWGVISYEVPLKRFPDTYNGHPLTYVALAAQKNAYSLYLMAVYQDPNKAAALKQAFAKAGKKLDMGKSCVRFGSLDDLPLDAIADVVAATPVDDYLDGYQRSRKKK